MDFSLSFANIITPKAATARMMFGDRFHSSQTRALKKEEKKKKKRAREASRPAQHHLLLSLCWAGFATSFPVLRLGSLSLGPERRTKKEERKEAKSHSSSVEPFQPPQRRKELA